MSPDGQSVAYTLQDPRRRETTGQRRFLLFGRTGATVEAKGCDVWVTQIATGASKNLSGGQGTNWGPVWSPDGRALAFYSDRDGRARIWIWNAGTDQVRPLGEAVVRPLFGFEVPQWTPDGKRLLTKILPEGQSLDTLANAASGARERTSAPGAKDGVTAVVYRSPSTLGLAESGGKPTSWMDASLADLALIDVETGTVHRIARGERPRGYWITADGTKVAYITVKGNESEQSQQVLYDLYIHTLESGSTRVVATGLRLDYAITVSWSPDGTRLAFLTDGPKAQGDCFVVSATGGEPVKLTPGTHPSLAHPYRPPLWDEDGKSLYCIGAGGLWKITVADSTFRRITQGEGPPITDILAASHGRLWGTDAGKSAIVVTRDDATKRVGYQRVELQSGRRVRLLEEDKFYYSAVFNTRVARAGAEVVYLAEDARHGADLWSAAPNFREPRRITRVNPQLDKLTFGPSRLVEWRGIDGDILRGALLLPAGYRKDRRCPMVVLVYGGGSLSNGLNRFGLSGTGVRNLQLLATRGFAVLGVDAPVRPGTVARDLLKAVMPGVEEVVKLGIADPDRLGVMGHSFGGYSTLALITQTTRFRAAVASAGAANWVSYYGEMAEDGSAFGVSYCEEGQPGLGGPPWAFPQRYIDNSPVFFLDRVRTPLLLVQGAIDTVVSPSQCDEVFVGLRRLGREVTYARYEGEGHWPGEWSAANAADYLTRLLDWFERHLAPPAGEKSP